MKYLIDPLLEISEYGDILKAIKNYSMPVTVTGPSESQKAHFCHALCSHSGNKGIYICYNEIQARKFYEDFAFFFGDNVVHFPSREILLYDIEAKSYDDVFERIRALNRIISGQFSLIVTSVEAMAHKLIPSDLFISSIIEIKSGQRVNLTDLSQKLVSTGYERVDSVQGRGQFAIRGGIIDVFSIDSEMAVRVEFFDDEVDSIRSFDTSTQRSVNNLNEVRIIPAREVIYPVQKREKIIEAIQRDLKSYISRLENKKDKDFKESISSKIEGDIDKLRNSYYYAGIDRLIPYIIDTPFDITQYVKNPLVFIDEPARFKQRIENIIMEYHETYKNLMDKGKILPGSLEIYFNGDDLEKRIEDKRLVFLSTLPTGELFNKRTLVYGINSKQMSTYHGQIDLLTDDIIYWKKQGSRVIALSGTRGKADRLIELLESKGVEATYTDRADTSLEPSRVYVMRGSINKGFEYPGINLVVISDKEIFGQEKKVKKAVARKKGKKLELFTDLNPGDYVVHQSNGIGQYVGIEQLTVDSVKRDYMKIRYQDGASLYIPTNQMDLIQKYIGADGKTPKLNKLGGAEWNKTKKRVKESLRELAGELVKLYAQRQELRGHAYSPDTVWQNQFEELFPYEETEDQLRCIEEIKRDMEMPRPMDRLLCGDVGFGKTEVAIRAIFKAVNDGKQVAYLVPTTILADQHYKNFKERFKDFPAVIDVISRFRSPAEQKKVLNNVKAGIVDVLIGTHRLLQKDIQFKDLGLLVIDEEQRFGVEHKELLKNFKPNIDVLTMSATPIPRTLHMSLAGIRDISTIEQPPEERYPVQTYVMEYNHDVIRDAIIRELSRNGQIFYLFNRVRGIDIKAAELQALVPDARFAVAHGQMNEKQLEDIMVDFINGEYDVLVCTTIIESGLDMPNVNTIIVEDADKMGLAQLYQLRGRVGRSNRLAYAYITYRRDKVLAEVAEKRLQAIKEFTEFGSGFKIAMRDMEIRGSGNLLGPEQHGHMESVGYDMYCRLLHEAVRELNGEQAVEDTDVSIDININAYIDENYIPSEQQKIEMYKKIAIIQEDQDVMDIEDELIDRYGDLPEAVRNLINIAHIKAYARRSGISAITEKSDSIIINIRNSKLLNFDVIGKLASKYKGQLLFNASQNPYIAYKLSGIKRTELLDNIKILLQDVKSFAV